MVSDIILLDKTRAGRRIFCGGVVRNGARHGQTVQRYLADGLVLLQPGGIVCPDGIFSLERH